MNKRTIIIFGAVLVLVIVLAIFFRVDRSEINLPNNPEVNNNNSPAAPTGTAPTGSQTVEDVPAGTTVPDKGAQGLPKEVAIPNTVVPAGPNTTAQLRSFNTNISKSGFEPKEFIVNQKDTVHLDITSSDGTYTIVQPDYGLSQTISRGETKLIQFDANNVGKYMLYCQSCGPIGQGPQAFVTVVPPQ